MFTELKNKYVYWKCSIYKKKKSKVNRKYENYKQKYGVIIQEQLELNSEYGKEKAWQEKYIKSKAYLAIAFGIFMLILTLLLSYICETSSWSKEGKALCEALITVLNSVFSIIIGIGISTLVLDFFSYIKYTRERIKEIMLDKKYLDTLSNKEKKNIINICEQGLYFKNGEVTDNSLYSNIRELMIPLIEENYYKQYKVHVDCYIDEANNTILKKVHKIMDIECIEDNKKFKIPFSTYLEKVNGIDNDRLYKLEECTVDGKNITSEVKKEITCSDIINAEGPEDVKFTLDHEFCLNRGLNRIVIRTETIVPISDNTYAHTITIPCKRYSINFSIHNSKYDVLGFAFAFDDEKHKNDIDRIIYRDKYEDCFKIRFENWTLPGDGVVFVINKK